MRQRAEKLRSSTTAPWGPRATQCFRLTTTPPSTSAHSSDGPPRLSTSGSALLDAGVACRADDVDAAAQGCLRVVPASHGCGHVFRKSTLGAGVGVDKQLVLLAPHGVPLSRFPPRIPAAWKLSNSMRPRWHALVHAVGRAPQRAPIFACMGACAGRKHRKSVNAYYSAAGPQGPPR